MKNLLSLTSPHEFIKIYSPIRNEIFLRTQKNHVYIPKRILNNRSKVARIIDRQYLDNNGVMDPRKIVVFDNSQKGYRFSGNQTKSYREIQKLINASGVSLSYGKPGTYVSRKANNGLFPTLASERGYYRNTDAYNEILGGDTSLLKDYFDFEGLMKNQYIIQHDIAAPIPYIDLEERATKESILEINKDPINELLLLYKDFQIAGLPHPDDVDELIEFLIYGDVYDFSQPLGNALLESSTAIQFSSARARVAPNQQYFEGGGNMVIPNTLFGNLPFDGTYYALHGKQVIKYANTGNSVFSTIK
ncbi:hypothetical protein [Pseudomonas zhanjiangensis]|uniref:Uncharacterized protein n=1 Tax=Pseudomonas zhanjiangensis TaxID=3239015 RepID=A0ABV3YMT4_9PSED